MKPRAVLGLCLLLSFSLVGCDDGVTDDEDPEVGGAVWLARFAGFDTEAMEDVLITSDGGYLITGTTLSGEDESGDVWLLKVNDDGTVVWQKTYGGPDLEFGYDAKETSSGGYVVAAATASFSNGGTDIWVFEVDADGGMVWERSYGGSGVEQAWSIDVTADGGYVVAGGTTSFGAGGSDALVLKLDGDGGIVWQKAFGGPLDDAPGGEYDEHVARVFEDGDGNLVVSTVTYSFGSGDSDVWVLKLDPDGAVIWENAYGDEDEDGMWAAEEVEGGGGYLVPGYFTPIDDYDTDLWGLRLNPDGTVAWQKTYGVSGIYDEALALGPAADGGVLFGGSYYEEGDTDWSWTFARVDAGGNLVWNRKYERGFDWPNAIAELSDGGFVAAGVTLSSLAGQEDLWLMKTAPDGTIGADCPVVADLPISEETTAVTPVATAATVTDTDITPQTTTASVANTDLAPTFDCSE